MPTRWKCIWGSMLSWSRFSAKTSVSASAANAAPVGVPSTPNMSRTRRTPQRYILSLRHRFIAGISLACPCRPLASTAVMVHHKQQLPAKPAQEPYHDSCRVPESISRMTPYGFHHKLGYVNCKGVLEYRSSVAKRYNSCRQYRYNVVAHISLEQPDETPDTIPAR